MKKLFVTLLLLEVVGGARVDAEDAAKEPQGSGEKLVAKFDKNKDGFLQAEELPQMLSQRLSRMDVSGDGKLSAQELDKVPERMVARLTEGSGAGEAPRRGGKMEREKKPGEEIAPAAKEEFDEQKLKPGDTAPDFTLKRRDGEGTFKLSSFKGEKPVVLVFGSITCSPFRQKVMAVKPLYEQYKDKAEFVMVYIREAHPESVIQVKEGGKEVLKKFEQTDSFAQRMENAQYCSGLLELPFPIVVDGDDNQVKEAYAGWPIRLVVVDKKGKIAFDGGKGPKGFEADKLGDWLAGNL
jgi:thiol-disulfide isomerase/thioredoxin